MRKLEMDELGRHSVEEHKKAEKIPVVLVLDNVRSMNNVGSVFRTSDAFLVEKIILCGITAKPPHREISKTALGADESVEWAYFEKISEAVESLKNDGYTVIGVEQTDKSQSLEDFQIEKEKKYALIFGNEAFGISDEILADLDGAIEIPQYGTKHSLNISVSAGVVIWEFLKKLRIEN